MNGMGFDINSISAMTQLLENPENLARLLNQTSADTGDTPAEVFADVINMIRADQKRIAQEAGVEVDVKRMTPDRAAQLLAGTVNGEGVEIVEMFNAEAETRQRILRGMIGDDEYEQFEEQKKSMLFTSAEGE